MHIKKTNLCISADVATTAELLSLAEEVGDQICVMKTHADIVSDFTDRTARALLDVATRKRFIIFEDRKFGDIGSKSSLLH
jgi:uridine monophosphate synthetase